MTSTPVKLPSASKSLCLFNKILNVKKKTVNRHFGATKSKHIAIKLGDSLWTKRKQSEKGIQKSMSILNVI